MTTTATQQAIARAERAIYHATMSWNAPTIRQADVTRLLTDLQHLCQKRGFDWCQAWQDSIRLNLNERAER